MSPNEAIKTKFPGLNSGKTRKGFKTPGNITKALFNAQEIDNRLRESQIMRQETKPKPKYSTGLQGCWD